MKKKIVILGGGFAGLQLAEGLNNSEYAVVLIDKLNHHQFQPLFYQVASARLEPSNISFPFRKIFQKSKNIQILMADVQRILPLEKTVVTESGNISYDYLVLATGCTTNYFGNEGLKEHAFPMKSTEEAIHIRNEILLSFESFIFSTAEERAALLNIVIVGAGPTGVELSGAFAEMRKDVLPKDYPGMDFSKLEIILLEGSNNTLNSMSEASRAASAVYLRKMGVQVRTGTVVTGYDGLTLTLNNGEQIRSRNVIWAAGVKGNLIEGLDQKAVSKGRYLVNRYNQLELYPDIYAIGDIAGMATPKYPAFHPQLANVAINQGKNLAHNFLADLRNKKRKEYEYRDLGAMATIGKYKAVIDLPFIKFHGVLAWFTWMFLHLMLILGVRNKLFIFINWAWNFFTKDTSLRLIFKRGK
jgi:NADH:ubiquinone reductase (H+-translocating)